MRPTMAVSLLCIGKLKDQALKELAGMYTKRLERYAKFQCQEIPHGRVGRRHQVELSRVERQFSAARVRVALDVTGRPTSSTSFAHLLRKTEDGGGGVSFLIGGPEGIPRNLLTSATHRMSLSQCTFPHELFRVLFLEQLYRAFTIVRGEPYHK